MPKDPHDLRASLRRLGDLIKVAAGKDVGFALWVETAGAWSYTSNCQRGDVVKTMVEWLSLTERGLVKSPGRTETSHQVDDRLALERKCSEIGLDIGETCRMGLFLFEFGPDTSSAYVTNVTDFRERVVEWVKTQQKQN